MLPVSTTKIKGGWIPALQKGGDRMVIDGTIVAVFIFAFIIIAYFLIDTIEKWQAFIVEKKEAREKKANDETST